MTGNRWIGDMIMAVKKGKQSPSKIKYDAKHPVLSFRLSLELKERLESYIEEKGISNADFIKEALDVKGARDEELKEEAYDAGYEAGYESGLEKGKEHTEEGDEIAAVAKIELEERENEEFENEDENVVQEPLDEEKPEETEDE